jgi:hypothetical protein
MARPANRLVAKQVTDLVQESETGPAGDCADHEAKGHIYRTAETNEIQRRLNARIERVPFDRGRWRVPSP